MCRVDFNTATSPKKKKKKKKTWTWEEEYGDPFILHANSAVIPATKWSDIC